MRALMFNFADKSLTLKENSKPKLENPTDVLVQVKYAGICGTDLHIIQGEFPCLEDRPLTLGHEFSGIVTEVGKDVFNVKVGDRVSVDPNHGCGVCNFCRDGDPHFCKRGGLNNTIGIYKNGGWAEYCLVPDAQVHKLPDSISLEQAALCEPLSCLSHGIDRIRPIHIGKRILVAGAGIIGNLWIVALHLQGHRKVTVSEPNVKRLEKLKAAFPEFCFLTPSEMEKIKEECCDYAFDVIVDCSGNGRAIEQAFNYLESGGKLCMFGVAPPHAKVSISPYQIFKQELTIYGVNINPFSFPNAIGLAESLSTKYLNYDLLGVKTYKLDEYEAAMKTLKEGSIAKAVFKM